MSLPARTPSIAIALAVALLFTGVFGASTSAQEDLYSERTMEIGRQLSCPVCEGQTVADSHSRVALEMLQSVESQVQAGRTDEEIFDYFRARYGDEVLVEPPREGINLALWWLPVITVAVGLGVVVLYFRDSAALGRGLRKQPQETSEDPELELIARRALNNDADPETT